MSVESMMPSNYLILYCPLLLLPSVFPNIRVFSNESAVHIRWSKYWSFSFSISPSSECSWLISFRIDWFDLLAVQRTFKGSSPAPQFEGISSLAQLFLLSSCHIHTCLLENHSFDKWNFVGKVMSLHFNMLSRLVTAFLPRNKCLLIS